MNPITIIAFHPTGYELHIPVTFEELPATMRRLAARGYTPSREPMLTAEGLPICPRHGVPMMQRKKQGDNWFSHKLVHPETGETMYCRGYASASSPGYDILLPLAQQAGKESEEATSEPVGMDNSNQVTANKPEVVTTNNGRSLRLNSAAAAQNDAKLHTALFGQRP